MSQKQKNVSVYIGNNQGPTSRAVEALARANGCSESELLKTAFKEYCEQNGLYCSDREKWNVKRIGDLEKKYPKRKKLKRIKFSSEGKEE